MSIIKNLLKKDFKLLINDPVSLAFMLLLPLVISLVAQTVFAPKKNAGFVIPIAFVDQDKSDLSRFFSGAMDNDRMKDNFNFIKMTEAEGNKAIEENEIAGVFIIPKGFEENFFNGEKCGFKLIKNPARALSVGILEDVFTIATDGLDGARVLFKDEIKTIYKMNDFNAIKLLALTKIAYDKIESMKDIVMENRLEFVKEEKKEESVSQSMAIYFLPGMAFMTTMFVIAGFFKKLIEEIESMTVTRILVAPVSSSQILIAKFIYTILTIIVVQAVLWFIAVPLFKINILDYSLFIKGIIYMTLTATVFIATLYSIPFKAKAVEAMSSVSIIVICLVSGIFITPHTMPSAISKIINKSPFYFPIKSITSACGTPETGLSLTNQLIFISFILVLGFISLLLFKNKINRIAKG